ncbi:MAG: hypothetical protein AMXMBFR58_15280 [Phycisphaerae bacterium]
MALKEFAKLCRLSEDEARGLLEEIRWPEGAVCSHCGSQSVTLLKGKATRPGVYKCKEKGCRKQFTVTTGTIFHGSHVPLRDWVYVFTRMCASKKGVSALQIKRELGCQYKTAWFMCHRIRYCMTQEPLAGMLKGVVEADEAWVGGKPRKLAGPSKEDRRVARMAGRKLPHTTKTPVQVLVVRGGNAVTRVVTDVTEVNLQGAIRDLVHPSSEINTDEHRSYIGIGRYFEGGHKSVCHSDYEYFRHSDGAGINTAESYFSLLKRGVYGVFHNVSKRHLGRYLWEFDYRWNHRKTDDRARTIAAIKGADGKRLSYKRPKAAPMTGIVLVPPPAEMPD